ncbi:hypothetical protein CONLIGDRAFT_16772 [Coniochaeta ligniaria NRRL 30616]|uniref:Uncharacterized protein n=1 Tax=Coniochaeta ligniaria NRRL 30616 TaxID=1408157 RepID=A0A1J7K3F9_9PEZI|nr:hypothetical protein CONLIGDRAFT_16772 [Coniochaeta ligniaria NRRL 30616]
MRRKWKLGSGDSKQAEEWMRMPRSLYEAGSSHSTQQPRHNPQGRKRRLRRINKYFVVTFIHILTVALSLAQCISAACTESVSWLRPSTYRDKCGIYPLDAKICSLSGGCMWPVAGGSPAEPLSSHWLPPKHIKPHYVPPSLSPLTYRKSSPRIGGTQHRHGHATVQLESLADMMFSVYTAQLYSEDGDL